MKKIISVSIHEELSAFINWLCKKRNVTRSLIVEEALLAYAVSNDVVISPATNQHRAPKRGHKANLSETQPWVAEGISRSSWYRKQKIRKKRTQ